MRVLLLGPYPPPHGGIQTHLVAIRQFLLDRRIPCSVINLTRHRANNDNGIYYPSNGLGVIARMMATRPTIIHLHIGNRLSRRLIALGWAMSLVPGSRIVLSCHSGGYPHSASRRSVGRLVARRTFRRFDAVIAVNAEVAAYLRREGVEDGRVRLISPFAYPTLPSTEPVPGTLGTFMRDHEPRLISISGLEPEYDLPSQIEALELIRQRYPSAGLAIVGGGSREAEIRAALATVPHGENVMICGDLPHAVTLRVLAESDVFLRTTRYDGDAISLREALHYGVPAVATDTGMRPPGVELVPFSDAHAIARAVQKILGRREARIPCGSAGRSENIEAVVRLYDELLRTRLVASNARA